MQPSTEIVQTTSENDNFCGGGVARRCRGGGPAYGRSGDNAVLYSLIVNRHVTGDRFRLRISYRTISKWTIRQPVQVARVETGAVSVVAVIGSSF